ncbi:MAG TPA: tetraacyldisaccharide 4'-kinase [Rikenellaceae bacterium]|nr:tetraacyldisaccharide 4'-kinase [Rikenellaceae bacterium]
MLYKLILKLRDAAYRSGRKKSFRAALPTVCVGNVTVGGTGKTPHTEMLLRMLRQENGVAVLSRGYGRKTKGFLVVKPNGSSRDFGDEPLQIARKFPDRLVAVDRDRIEGCEKLKEFGAKLVILDDAFQYRKLKADLDIVLVNYARPVFNDSLLPWGRLRDLPERIFDADIIIVSKCPADITDDEKSSFIKKLRLKDYNSHTCDAFCADGKKIKVLFSNIKYLNPVMVFPEGDPRFIYSQRIMYLSGIADGKRLEDELLSKYKILKFFEFGDHHDFSKGELARVEKALRKAKACALATTEKDAQRLLSLDYVSSYLKERLFMVPIEANLSTPSEKETLLCVLNKLK